MLFCRWIHKPGAGHSRESTRLQRRKEEWLSYLDMVTNSHNDGRHDYVSSTLGDDERQMFPTTAGSVSMKPKIRDSILPGPYLSTHPSTVSKSPIGTQKQALTQTQISDVPSQAITITKFGASNEGNPLLESDVAENEIWLSDGAHRIYINNRDRRLASWGVTPEHQGTCILVPARWALEDPQAMMDDPTEWPRSEFGVPRLVSAMCLLLSI